MLKKKEILLCRIILTAVSGMNVSDVSARPVRPAAVRGIGMTDGTIAETTDAMTAEMKETGGMTTGRIK